MKANIGMLQELQTLLEESYNAQEFGCASDAALEGLVNDLNVAQRRMENYTVSSHPESVLATDHVET